MVNGLEISICISTNAKHLKKCFRGYWFSCATTLVRFITIRSCIALCTVNKHRVIVIIQMKMDNTIVRANLSALYKNLQQGRTSFHSKGQMIPMVQITPIQICSSLPFHHFLRLLKLSDQNSRVNGMLRKYLVFYKSFHGSCDRHHLHILSDKAD